MPEAITDNVPPRSKTDFMVLGLVIGFLISYVLVVESERWELPAMIAEVVIALIFLVWQGNFWLMIYPGWQVSSILARYPKKYMIIFSTVYYIGLVGEIVSVMVINGSSTSMPEWFTLAIPLVGPVLSYATTKSINQRIQLAQDNQRLESIIRRGERDRIARDLHDTLGQSFSMITIKTQLAKKLLTKQPDQVSNELDDIIATSRENLQVVRQIVNNLHQVSISEEMLIQSKNLRTVGIHLETTGESISNQWPTSVQVIVGDVIKEAVTNVIRHSKANQVEIEFTESNSDYQVSVTDNGRANKYVREGSNGIDGMKSRIHSSGGQFEINNNNPGTKVWLSLPKEVAHD
ncbi:sensor histidine kinase [Lentilactobacillus sp. Marseille-Q4993]|uniref:sensor histidine kinase n=1 Tax=Lentilactobacillus sp. Marseille-Q4993 TaxID=3039492 RepID=UPI0024BC762B|nr:sensor histidine kinase [Lentilactobacillus sp. Marseille-Q4993]